jgi:predicted O-methyltransferase YrrM
MSKYFRERFPKAYKRYQEIYGEVRYELLNLGPLARRISRKRLHRLELTCKKPFEVVKQFKGVGLYHTMAPVQIESEITELFNTVKDRNPKVICEVGTDRGGTLYLWSKSVRPDGLVISIDLPRTYRKSLNRFFRFAFFEKKRIYFLRENSQSLTCQERVRRILNGKPIDFLFIDGDHSYEGAKKDFLLYAPFVKKSGIIAFHDILDACGVDRFWSEIRKGHRHYEIVEDYRQKSAGIGVLYY